MSEQPNPQNARTFTEELEMAGKDLVERVKQLIEEGNVRRVIIRNAEGRTLLEVPLTAGAVVGGVLALYMPLFAGLAALGALVAKLKIEVVREMPEDGEDSGEAKG
ncbi:MAG: DUF4342 domain-containing protein [Chloroflexi bacterium]|nr:DUF4342 domain-containing protein [Chloroflexota bacterium]